MARRWSKLPFIDRNSRAATITFEQATGFGIFMLKAVLTDAAMKLSISKDESLPVLAALAMPPKIALEQAYGFSLFMVYGRT